MNPLTELYRKLNDLLSPSRERVSEEVREALREAREENEILTAEVELRKLQLENKCLRDRLRAL